MQESELIEKLNSMIRLDNDALSSYNKVLDNINEQVIKSEITKYRDDHLRHVDNLSGLIIKYGGVPTRDDKDIRGLFLGSATAIQNIAGLQGSLMALQTGEKLTNKDYSEAVSWNVPEDVLLILKDNYEDEKRHLRFINQAIADKVWERR